MQPEGYQLVDAWYLVAGAVGALGNQVLYWRRLLRARKTKVDGRKVFLSSMYVLTGGAVGFFVGTSTSFPVLAMGSGATWPATLRSIQAARHVGKTASKQIKDWWKSRKTKSETSDSEPGENVGDGDLES